LINIVLDIGDAGMKEIRELPLRGRSRYGADRKNIN
jgi:hypothetical protein